MSNCLVIISGPTAVGKTALTIELAQAFNSVILSCDSRQFFREMTIGTAKPTSEELAQVPHYFINSHSILDNYTVGDYEKEALKLLQQLFQKHQVVFMTGGSGLYIKAICEGLDVFPTVKAGVREQLIAEHKKNGLAYLQQELQRVDPDYYNMVDKYNPQRIIRALEIYRSTQQAYSSFRTQPKAKRPFHILKIGLHRDRAELYERINRRVELMMESGLLEEVKKLLPYQHLNALQTVGYQELFDYLNGKHDLETAIALIQRNSRRYAKRQLTWFRRDGNWQWFLLNEKERIKNYIINGGEL